MKFIIKDEILRRIREIEDGGKDALGKKTERPVILLEAALLVEGNLSELCDEVWYIFAPKAVRLKRLRESRGYSREKALSIMARQLSYREFRAHSDYVIHNGSDFTITQADIHRRMKEIFTSLCDSEV